MPQLASTEAGHLSATAALHGESRAPAPTIVKVLTPRGTRKVQSTHRRRRRLTQIRRFLCRVDVCWTLFFFVFLVCVAVLTTSITQTKISRALLENMHDLHNLHIATIFKIMDQSTDSIFNMAAGFLALHSQKAFELRSEITLSALCTILSTYDTSATFRSLAVTSLNLKEAISCMHGDSTLGSRTQLYGWITENSVIPGVYLVNNSTFEFDRPLKPVYGGWPTTEYNLSDTFNSLHLNTAVFREAAAYFSGLSKYIDYRTMWRSFATLPHIVYCTIPAGFLFRGLNLPSNINVTDYVDVRVNGAGILMQQPPGIALTNITAAIFINASLTEKDPLVMSNNWGQPSVNDMEILSTEQENQVSYLAVSDISNPLMRAALKHIDLKGLQQEGYNQTVDFQYRGAPATVTAATITTERGLILPMVFVGSHAEIARPYRRIMDICNGVTAVVIVAFTALFWWLIKTHLRDPLQRITVLLLKSVKRGSRAVFRVKHANCFALTEVQQLGEAHSKAMLQLREIDTFIPEAARHLLPVARNRALSTSVSLFSPASADSLGASRSPGKLLMRHLSTVVYITIREKTTSSGADAHMTLLASADGLPRRHRLAAIAANAARSVPMVNSGPFPSPAALEAFVEKLHELCELHHGVVHRLAPDTCVVHFFMAVQEHNMECSLHAGLSGANSTTDPSPRQRKLEETFAKRDAKNAVKFSFKLQAWWDSCDRWTLPDIQLLLDTSIFSCGHYRPNGSEQMIPIAIGRDVQREVGSVPAAIGVRIAMTEETASCVRAGVTNDATGEVEPGVRQLPVEELRTGRIGLDADVVVLFEVLPGAVTGNVAWRQYQRCCFDGFSFMVRGDYPAALRAYKEVMEISDLEPGLMPSSLRREAAASDVTGGAVSVQVERLMRECVQHVLKHSTESFHRRRVCPLGIDAVLGGAPMASAASAQNATYLPSSGPRSLAVHAANANPDESIHKLYPKAQERHVVDLVDGKDTIRTVIGHPPDWLRDNSGLFWQLATRPIDFTPRGLWGARFGGLGSAGAVATLNLLAFRDVPRPVANAIRTAPLGPMSDALRSATPVYGPTQQQEDAVRSLFKKLCELHHPNLLMPLGYSMSVEGGVALLWEFNAGGTLRQVLTRYASMKPILAAQFLHGVLSALVYLHEMDIAHGAVHVDNVMVGADGVCRLHGHHTDVAAARKLFVLPRSCYVSPAMAAGELPTPACDVFCCGLMCIKLLSRSKPWRWAPICEGERQEHTEEELEALMEAAEQPFFDAVVDGRIIVNTEILETLSLIDDYVSMAREALQQCFSLDATKRPSALQMRSLTESMLCDWQRRRNDDLKDK